MNDKVVIRGDGIDDGAATPPATYDEIQTAIRHYVYEVLGVSDKHLEIYRTAEDRFLRTISKMAGGQ